MSDSGAPNSCLASQSRAHRDIKTGNAMREEGGRILLMDFGLTHESGNGPNFAGTPVYMAPELWSGETATAATDVSRCWQGAQHGP